MYFYLHRLESTVLDRMLLIEEILPRAYRNKGTIHFGYQCFNYQPVFFSLEAFSRTWLDLAGPGSQYPIISQNNNINKTLPHLGFEPKNFGYQFSIATN
jgi:hypothetical protein